MLQPTSAAATMLLIQLVEHNAIRRHVAEIILAFMKGAYDRDYNIL